MLTSKIIDRHWSLSFVLLLSLIFCYDLVH